MKSSIILCYNMNTLTYILMYRDSVDVTVAENSSVVSLI